MSFYQNAAMVFNSVACTFFVGCGMEALKLSLLSLLLLQ